MDSPSLIFERHFPKLAAVGCLFIAWLLDPGIEKQFKDVLTATISVASIAAGFLVTAATILISIEQRWLVQRLKESGVYRRVVQYLFIASSLAIVLSIVSVLGLLLNFDYPITFTWIRWAFALWLGLAGAAAAALARILYLLAVMMSSLD